MLKAVVQQVKAFCFLLSQQACFVALRTQIDRHMSFACDQQRLVTEPVARRRGRRIHSFDGCAAAAISAGQNIDRDAVFRQQLCQSDDKRRFAAAAGRKITDTDDRPAQPLLFHQPVIVCCIFCTNSRPIKWRERCQPSLRVHRPAPSSVTIASAARFVAPACASNTFCAFLPSA